MVPLDWYFINPFLLNWNVVYIFINQWIFYSFFNLYYFQISIIFNHFLYWSRVLVFFIVLSICWIQILFYFFLYDRFQFYHFNVTHLLGLLQLLNRLKRLSFYHYFPSSLTILNQLFPLLYRILNFCLNFRKIFVQTQANLRKNSSNQFHWHFLFRRLLYRLLWFSFLLLFLFFNLVNFFFIFLFENFETLTVIPW